RRHRRLGRNSFERCRSSLRIVVVRVTADGETAAMHGLRSSLHLDVARESPDMGRARPVYATAGCYPLLGPDRSSRPHDIYGWASSPAGVRASHVPGFFNGTIQREHTDDHDDTYQTRL